MFHFCGRRRIRQRKQNVILLLCCLFRLRHRTDNEDAIFQGDIVVVDFDHIFGIIPCDARRVFARHGIVLQDIAFSVGIFHRQQRFQVGQCLLLFLLIVPAVGGLRTVHIEFRDRVQPGQRVVLRRPPVVS